MGLYCAYVSAHDSIRLVLAYKRTYPFMAILQ